MTKYELAPRRYFHNLVIKKMSDYYSQNALAYNKLDI